MLLILALGFVFTYFGLAFLDAIPTWVKVLAILAVLGSI